MKLIGTALTAAVCLLCALPVAAENDSYLQRGGTGQLTAPVNVLLTGDSLMESLGPQMQRELQGYTNLRFIPIGRKSTGLSRPDFYNWPQVLEQHMKSESPRVVIMWVGTNDPQNIHGVRNTGTVCSAEWQKAYYNKLLEILRIVRNHKARFILLGPPVMDEEPLNSQLASITKLMQWTCRRYGAVFIDTRPLLADKSGRYLQQTQLADGSRVTLRTRDHVHITPEGNRLIMDRLLPELAACLSTPKQRATTQKKRSTGTIRGGSIPHSPRVFR